jgi:hypothetical protein
MECCNRNYSKPSNSIISNAQKNMGNSSYHIPERVQNGSTRFQLKLGSQLKHSNPIEAPKTCQIHALKLQESSNRLQQTGRLNLFWCPTSLRHFIKQVAVIEEDGHY